MQRFNGDGQSRDLLDATAEARDERDRDSMTTPPPGWIPADEWTEQLHEAIKDRVRPLIAAKILCCWPGGTPCDIDDETCSIGIDVMVPTMDAEEDEVTLRDGTRCRATSDLRLAVTSIVEMFALQLEAAAAAVREGSE